MENVYAAPESDLREQNSAHRTGGSVEDAIAGNIEIGMITMLVIICINPPMTAAVT